MKEPGSKPGISPKPGKQIQKGTDKSKIHKSKNRAQTWGKKGKEMLEMKANMEHD